MKQKKTICIATGTRAEYGLLKPLILRLKENMALDICLLVTGSHLCPEFGYTYQEIERDGLSAHAKIEMVLSSDTPAGMAKSTGLGIISFAEYFQFAYPDLLIVLGDRFEMFACATAAAMMQIPMAHLYGGDTTEGVTDEFVRHSITKMSQLHFTSNEEARRRVIQLGEHPARVFNVGALGVENALHMELLSRKDMESRLGLRIDEEYVLMTYHPVTLEQGSAGDQMRELFCAVETFPQYQYIATKANADSQGRVINKLLEEYAKGHENFHVFASLGALKYLSCMKYAKMIIGNSSSGLYETPCFGVACVNIGDRQKGRLRAGNVIDCDVSAQGIMRAMEKAASCDFQKAAKIVKNPFGDGNTSKRIVEIITRELAKGPIDVKKEFYKLEPYV